MIVLWAFVLVLGGFPRCGRLLGSKAVGVIDIRISIFRKNLTNPVKINSSTFVCQPTFHKGYTTYSINYMENVIELSISNIWKKTDEILLGGMFALEIDWKMFAKGIWQLLEIASSTKIWIFRFRWFLGIQSTYQIDFWTVLGLWCS